MRLGGTRAALAVGAGIIAAGGAAALAFAGPGGSVAASHSFTNGLPPIVGAAGGAGIPGVVSGADIPAVAGTSNLTSFPLSSGFRGSLPLPVTSLLNSGFTNVPVNPPPVPASPQLPIQGPTTPPTGGYDNQQNSGSGLPISVPGLPGLPGLPALPGTGNLPGLGTVTGTLGGAGGGSAAGVPGVGSVTGVVGTVTGALGGATGGSSTSGVTGGLGGVTGGSTSGVPGVGSVTGVVGTVTGALGGVTGGTGSAGGSGCSTSAVPVVGGVLCGLLP